MRYGRYDFNCRFDQRAELPGYKGSTFRGVFGHALKFVVCTLKRQTCDTCLLKAQCIYARVFETHLTVSLPQNARMSAATHPFVIRPPQTEKTRYAKGDPFSFSLLLFGEMNHHLPYFIYAFDRMGRLGVDKKINGCRGRFTLEKVTHEGRTIYAHMDQRLTMDNPLLSLELSSLPDPSAEQRSLRLTINTPLRLKFDNRLTANLSFHLLTRSMLRRVSSLLSVYGSGEPQLDYKGLVKRATHIKNTESTLHWFDWKRYSARQDQKMLMGGMLGTVTYTGALDEFLPLITFCEKTHIGKQTAFGLGEISVNKE